MMIMMATSVKKKAPGGGGKAPVEGGAVAAGHAKGAWLGRANNNDGQRLTYSPTR